MRDVIWPLTATTWMQTVTSVMFLTVPVLAPALLADVGFQPSHVGLYTALVFLGAMPVSLVMGALASRFGALRVMQVGILASAVALLLSTAASLPIIMACGILLGAGYGPNTPGAAHILARVTKPRDRPLVFSIKQSGAPLGGFVAGLLIPLVVVSAGWREALMVSAALGLVTIVLVQPLRAKADDDRQPGRAISVSGVWAQLRLLAGHGGLRRLTVASFVFAGVQACTFAFLVIYLVDHVGLDLVAAGFAYSCMHLIGVGARITWGWLAGRFVRAAVVLAMLGVASATFVVVMAQFDDSWPFWVIVVISAATGATASGWNGVFMAEIARVAPQDQISAATGGSVFFTYFGLVVGPTIFAALVALTGGYDLAFYVIAGAIFLAAVLIWPRRDKVSRKPNSS
ncbi:MAG: MFS transporter [Rhodospirillaceae bacterium]|jgi:nitrate/nitrite transporter NarK|nr:MFS transporter [Rhodospirillaceae bacterium]MBT5191581.1 MFS transporter [Rhodospirillaceae bacterium]MBT5894920.1 MFS transporter [Rhodospirillaceae bacterium]MBT6430769.1 MFS transporter [Rhodospirillaceae bacterium]MBT7755709.1 MFS transporter [Rhodospirillaceae bacterium]